ncbi:MAG: kelch repeat-containing protein [Candidatus Bathyarchaeia archaeon]
MKKIQQFVTFAFLFAISFSPSSLLVSQTTATEDTWTTMASMPTPRPWVEVAVVNEKIYAIGGSYDEHGEVEEYDPITNSWSKKTPMPTPRILFGIAVIGNKIYTMGGDSGNWEVGQRITNVVEVYDPLTDKWETKSPMPTKRMAFSASVINGKIYIIGGQVSEPAYNSVLQTEVYDPETDTWTTAAPIPVPVGYHASVVLDGKIYILGGSTRTEVSASLNQIYDPETNSWSNGTAMPFGVDSAAAGATTGILSPKRIYVLGGKKNLDAVNLNQIYDPKTDTWTLGAPMPTARYGLGVAVVDDMLYAVGGREGWIGAPITGANERYTPIGIGKAPLKIGIISPKNETYNVENVSLTFIVTEATSWIGYSLDGQVNVTIAGNTTLTGLPDGAHSLTIYANDTAENSRASETRYFSIKTQQSELSPLWIMITIAVVVVAGAAYLIYLKKLNR